MNPKGAEINDKTCQKEFEILAKESKKTINGHCNQLRDTIELNFESIFDKLKKHKEILLNRISLFESECINEVDGKTNNAKKFQNENSQITEISSDKTDEFKSDAFKNRIMRYIESEYDPHLIVGKLEESIAAPTKKSFNHLKMFRKPNEPIYKYALDRYEVDPLNEMNGKFEHYIVAFCLDRFVLCVVLKSKFQIRLMQKKGDLIRVHDFQPPSEFLSFSANTTRLFILANQDKIKILYEFDENLLLRRVKEVYMV